MMQNLWFEMSFVVPVMGMASRSKVKTLFFADLQEEPQVQRRALVENPLTFSGHMTVYHFGFEEIQQPAEIGLFHIVLRPSYNSEYILAQASLFPITKTYSRD